MNSIKTEIISPELTDLYLGELGKLRKVTIRVVMSACLSVRQSVSPYGKTRSQLKDFHETL